jgi:hypothetical protein
VILDNRNEGKEASIMRKIAIIFMLVLTVGIVGRVQATIVEFHDDWIIHEGDEYESVVIFNDATLGMTGGVVGRVHANDSSRFNLFYGLVSELVASDASTVYMYGGAIEGSLIVDRLSSVSLFGGTIGEALTIPHSGTVNIYGYGFNWERAAGPAESGWLSGYWLDGTPFSMYLRNLPEPFPGSHVVLIPEPGALLFLALGSLGLRKRSLSGWNRDEERSQTI